MTIKQFNTLWTEALASPDRDAYISDWANSTLLLAPEAEEIPADLIDRLGRIWDAAHRTTKEIRALLGLTQRELAERLCISVRTVERWDSKGDCPDHVRLLIQQTAGLVEVPR